MKKIKINKGMSVLLASMLVAGSIVIGCSSDDVDTQDVTSDTQDVTSESKQAEKPKEETKAFKEVVLVNNEYCRECGAEIMDKAVICPKCGCSTGENKGINLDVKEVDGEKVYSKLVALLLWLFLGWIGAHRFYIGDSGTGAIYVLCLLFCWLFIPAFVLIGLLVYDLIQILANDHLGNSKISW